MMDALWLYEFLHSELVAPAQLRPIFRDARPF